METVQILREHVESSKDLENAAEFLDILSKASVHLKRQQSNNGIDVVRCINIEGKTLIFSLSSSNTLVVISDQNYTTFCSLAYKIYMNY